jgi:hypothetical protein
VNNKIFIIKGTITNQRISGSFNLPSPSSKREGPLVVAKNVG